ncbi:MAG: AMP-binding protein [Planctomycetes bacterium]|nr:AMP-binding protein [Planctomycetota bacterium]
MSERVATIESTEAATATRCNVSDYITEQARTRPDATAIIEQATGRRITFGELERTIQSLAAGLTQYGICNGTRAILAVRPGIEFVALVFALFRAAAVPIVVDPGMGRKNMLACIGEAKPEALIGISAAHALSKVFRKPFASVTKRVTVGRRWFWGGKTYSQLASVDASSFRAPQTRANDLAAILFTSGATGVPKGVEYEHGMFDGQVRAIRDYFGIQPGEIDVPCFALFALFTVGMGCTIVLPDMDFSKPGSCDPAKIVAAIEQHKASLTFGSPAVWARVAPWLAGQNRKFPETLRRILIAGASVPLKTHEALAELLPNGRVFTPYGATESLPVACIDGRTLLEKFAARMKSGEGTCVGKPLPGVDVRVIPVGATYMSPLPQGEIGEIIVSSATTTRKYFNRPEQTAASKLEARATDHEPRTTIFHRMGDVGYFDAEGNLWFCGRANHVVHTAQGPLYPDMVEGVFNAHANFDRSALIGYPVGSAEQHAAVVVEPFKGLTDPAMEDDDWAIELLELASKHAATRHIRRIVFDANFPLDVRHNAKIDRIELARRHALPVGGKGGSA